MTPEAQPQSPVEPCDVKGHLKDQGIILLAVAGLILLTAIGVIGIKSIRWLLDNNPNVGQTISDVVAYGCITVAGLLVLALIGYILYQIFEPSIDLLRCLQRQRRQRDQS